MNNFRGILKLNKFIDLMYCRINKTEIVELFSNLADLCDSIDAIDYLSLDPYVLMIFARVM